MKKIHLLKGTIMNKKINWKKITIFLILTFAISWTGSTLIYLSNIEIHQISGIIILTTVFMWAPGISALIIQLFDEKPIRKNLRLSFKNFNWIIVAWLTPIILLGLTIGIGTLFPNVSISTDYAAYLAEIGLTEAEISESMEYLEGIPSSLLPPLFIIQGLGAGITINAVAALGEELGWRGLLIKELSPLGFWKVSTITGVIWGIWHGPIILQGHNFPENPVIGIFIMVTGTLALSPIFTYITTRAKSIIAPSILHGTFNGLGSLTLVYLTGADNIIISPLGLAGIIAAVLGFLIFFIHDKYLSEKSIINSEELEIW